MSILCIAINTHGTRHCHECWKCSSGQGGEVVALDSAPFQLRRRLELPGGALSIGLRLRLGDAADAARRCVDARVDMDLAGSACAEQRVHFTTQARDYQ